MFVVLRSAFFSTVSDESGALFIHSCLDVYMLGKDPLCCGNPDLQLFPLLFFWDVISGSVTIPPQPSSELIAAMNMMLITWLFPFFLWSTGNFSQALWCRSFFLPVSREWFKTHCTLDNNILASNSLLPWFWSESCPSLLGFSQQQGIICVFFLFVAETAATNSFVLFVVLFTDQTRRWSRTIS